MDCGRQGLIRHPSVDGSKIECYIFSALTYTLFTCIWFPQFSLVDIAKPDKTKSPETNTFHIIAWRIRAKLLTFITNKGNVESV
jgi:hypothetical protein